MNLEGSVDSKIRTVPPSFPKGLSSESNRLPQSNSSNNPAAYSHGVRDPSLNRGWAEVTGPFLGVLIGVGMLKQQD